MHNIDRWYIDNIVRRYIKRLDGYINRKINGWMDDKQTVAEKVQHLCY